MSPSSWDTSWAQTPTGFFKYRMESIFPNPRLHEGKIVVLSDWDGTITTFDSFEYMTDNLGFGRDKRRAAYEDVMFGKVIFRDVVKAMCDSISANGHSFEECKELLKQNIKLDSGFADFYRWCRTNSIPFIIVSSGIEQLIRHLLANLLGEDEARDADIIANGVKIKADGQWEMVFRHPTSDHGHDKSQAILPYRALPVPPTLIFFGDGISDLSAARHSDILFVKTNDSSDNDLAKYCAREGIKHVLFNNFSQALPVVRSIVENGKISV